MSGTTHILLRGLWPTALFVVLTAVMTWPQPLVMSTHAAPHHDVYFNLWRVAWIAHALSTSPQNLFNGNVFHPERGTLTLSDAMLLEGLLGSPLLWAGVPPVLAHNLLLLGGIVASASGMFVLAHHLSGSRAAAIAAGIVFAFAPYRIEHYMHMELQWAMWIPWAFWAMQRTIETRAARFGCLAGVFVALQIVSSIYYGIFLAVLLPIVAVLQLLAAPGRDAVAVVQRLALGAAIAACAAALYATPYQRTSARVGPRVASEVTAYSAKPKDYLTATGGNLLYGSRSRGQPERRLFPGFAAPLLALVGLLLVAPQAATVAYLIGGVIAFELSLGMYGVVYPDLYEYVPGFEALRAPARAAIFSLLFLGVLAAHGCAAVLSAAKPPLRNVLGVAIAGGLLLEYWAVPLRLTPFPNSAPPLYARLAQLPDGVVAELPMPTVTTLPGAEPRYTYLSTFHWKPLVNGYSGYYPAGYLQGLQALEAFPDKRALQRLRDVGVTYVVVHEDAFSPEELEAIVSALGEAGLASLGNFSNGSGRAAVFRLR